MMYARLTLALLAPLLLASGIAPVKRPSASAFATAAFRKCRNPVQKEPLFFVDGRASTESALKVLLDTEVMTVIVTCLSAADSSIQVEPASTPGLGAVIVWTKTSPYAEVRPVMEALTRAQQAYFARTGRYGRDRATLQLPALPAEVKITLDARDNGWSATGWVDRRYSPKCRIFDGEVAASGKTAKGAIGCDEF